MKISPSKSPRNNGRCATFTDSLKAYHDGELSLTEQFPIRLHLFQCPACREEIQQMEKITNKLQTADSAVLDTNLRSRLLEGIPASTAPIAPETKRFRFRRPDLSAWKTKPRLAWATAAVACLAIFVFQVTPKILNLQSSASENQIAASESKIQPQLYDEMAHRKSAPTAAASPAVRGMVSTPTVSSPQDMEASGRSVAMARKMPSYVPESTLKFQNGMAGMSGYIAKRSFASAAGQSMSASPIEIQRQVHREASLSLEVEKLEETSASIEDMIKATGGYIATNDLSSADDGTKSASLVAKIPVLQFDEIMGRLSKLGSVKAKSVNGEDLTEKMSDSRQAEKSLNQQIEEAKQRLAHLKGNSARRDEAENIRDLRVQEAQAEGRLELLKKMARLSTITIELHEKSKTQIAPQQSGFVSDMKENSSAALQSFIQAAKFPIMLVIWLAAYAPIWIVLVVTYKYIVRT